MAAAAAMEIHKQRAKERQKQAGETTHGHRHQKAGDLQVSADLREAVEPTEKDETVVPFPTDSGKATATAAQQAGVSTRLVEGDNAVTPLMPRPIGPKNMGLQFTEQATQPVTTLPSASSRNMQPEYAAGFFWDSNSSD